jgi:hypothetical protein
MNHLDTSPIESFLEQAKVALKTNQKSLNLDIRDVEALYDCLALTMTKIAGISNNAVNTEIPNILEVKISGGSF